MENPIYKYNGVCHIFHHWKCTKFWRFHGRVKRSGGSSSNCVRGFYFGGSSDTPSPGTIHDDCDSIIIATTGDSIDFGDLHTTTHGFVCNGVISNGHGGL